MHRFEAIKLMNTKQTTDPEPPSSKRFIFLDSFRGICALVVMLIHTNGGTRQIKTNGLLSKHDNMFDSILGFSMNYSHSFAVNGFFILSSFLLTYRLIIDYSKANTLVHNILMTTFKFFIRRFFRIYIPVVFFCTLVTLRYF